MGIVHATMQYRKQGKILALMFLFTGISYLAESVLC